MSPKVEKEEEEEEEEEVERKVGSADDEWMENRDERRSSMKEYMRCAVPLRG